MDNLNIDEKEPKEVKDAVLRYSEVRDEWVKKNTGKTYEDREKGTRFNKLKAKDGDDFSIGE